MWSFILLNKGFHLKAPSKCYSLFCSWVSFFHWHTSTRQISLSRVASLFAVFSSRVGLPWCWFVLFNAELEFSVWFHLILSSLVNLNIPLTRASHQPWHFFILMRDTTHKLSSSILIHIIISCLRSILTNVTMILLQPCFLIYVYIPPNSTFFIGLFLLLLSNQVS